MKRPSSPSLWRYLAPVILDAVLVASTVLIIIASASSAWPSATI